MFHTILHRTACKSDHRQRHAALLVKGGRPIRFAYNKNGKHAEHRAIMGISLEILKGATIYSFRLAPSGKVALAKPCEMCEKRLREAKVRKVWYTTDEGWEMEKL